tara:strand:- start:877 stop:1146 length:270 start_codon:yes stop_codon:yes gene_type:complete
MKSLPEHLQQYSTSPVFTEETVPKGLLKDHNTKSGVWGLICVNEGELEYIIEDKETLILSPKNKGVVEPEVKHHIKPLGAVTFYIEFYK